MSGPSCLRDCVSRDTSPFIEHSEYAPQVYKKFADLDGNNRTCGSGWEEVLQCD